MTGLLPSIEGVGAEGMASTAEEISVAAECNAAVTFGGPCEGVSEGKIINA
jgi:hypothetical protein